MFCMVFINFYIYFIYGFIKVGKDLGEKSSEETFFQEKRALKSIKFENLCIKK